MRSLRSRRRFPTRPIRSPPRSPRPRPSRRRSNRRRLPSPERQDGYELALQALGHKERTEAELAGWLRERGLEETELAEVLARLAEAGALDDERFARRFAEDKRELRRWGPDRIAEALRARGVAEAQIEAAIAAESDEAIVIRAVEVLADSGEEPIDDRSRARALALLARRGYPLEVAYDAVRAMERSEAA